MQRSELELGGGGRLGLGTAAGRPGVEAVAAAAREALDRGWVDEVIRFDNAHDLLAALGSGGVEMAVRGNLASLDLVQAWQPSRGKLLRAALLEAPRGRLHLLAPMGIEEQGADAITLASDLWHGLGGGEAQVAVLGPGRPEDHLRPTPIGDRILEGKQIADEAGADYVGILVEEALEHDVWIFDQGILGNLVFRSLHFLGGWQSLGGPVLGVGPVFIDTSAARHSWLEPLGLAALLTARQ